MSSSNLRMSANSVGVAFLVSGLLAVRNNPAHDEILKRLRDALTKGRVVKVGMRSTDSDIIEDVI